MMRNTWALSFLRNQLSGGGGGGGAGVTAFGTLLETGVTPGVVPLSTYAAGDVVFLFIAKADAGGHAGSTTPPSGWTLVANLNFGSNTISLQVFRKVMTGSEGTTVTHDWVTSGSVNAQTITVSGANTGGAITEGVATNTAQPGSAGSVNLTGAAVTTLGTNRIVLNFIMTARGINATMAQSVDAWTDVVMNNSSAQGLRPHTAISKQAAATAQAYTAETRTESQTTGGDILYGSISFGVIMV